MNKIINFDNEKEFINYTKIDESNKIDCGSEGVIYLTDDEKIIKYMIDPYAPKEYSEFPDIIMSDDLKLDSFIFPDELYILDGQIIGYKEDFFANNIFDPRNPAKSIDVEKLLKAREKLIEDAKVITDKGYKLFEFPGNVLYDTNKLVGIDTLDYYKKNNITLSENIGIIDYALILELIDIYPEIEFNIKNSLENEIEKIYKYERK